MLLVLVLAVQSGLVQWKQPTSIYLDFGPWCPTWPNCPTVTSQQSISTYATTNSIHVADTWQEWVVHYVSGGFQSFRSDTFTFLFSSLQLTQASGQPSWLVITFPTVLQASLPSYYSLLPPTEWKTVLKVDPLMTVLIDGNAAGVLSSLGSISFTSDDAVGTRKQWVACIIFSGSASCPSGAQVLDLTGSITGKTQAQVQVTMSQLWTHYRDWILSASTPPGCDIQIGFGQCMEQLSRQPVLSPYTLSFNWTPQATGPATFTWPTGIMSTSNNRPIQIWTQTGTATVTLWQSVTATLAGPKTTVTQTIGTNFNAGLTGNQTASTSGACRLLNLGSYYSGFIAPDWFCAKTFGISNWIIAVVAVLGLYLIFRRGGGGGSTMNINVGSG